MTFTVDLTADAGAQPGEPEAISTDAGATWFLPSGFTPGALEVDSAPEPAEGLLLGSIVVALFLRKRLTGLAGSR